MNLLLLSRHIGAVTPFLEGVVAGWPRPLRIGYVDDAQAPFSDAPFVVEEYDALKGLGHEVIRITLRDMPASELDRALAGLDVVYVASGSTFALLEALRATGGGRVLSDRVRAGLPYIGASAGSIVAGPDITPASLMDDPADGPALTSLDGLALIDQVVIPHADGLLPPYPPELIDRTLKTYGADYVLLPLRDDEALLIRSGQGRVVDSAPASCS